ncbi:MAG: flagellar biosynthesis protein FlhF [Melioribacteraceae bacterium]
MQIKKFTAPTLKEATEMMKEELGGDAIILGTRVIEGDRKFNAKKMFEITAGADEIIKKISVKNSESKKEERNIYEKEVDDINKKIFNSSNRSANSERESNETESKVEHYFKSEKLDKKIKEYSELLLERDIQKPIVKEIVKHLDNYSGLVEEKNLESYLLSSLSSMVTTKEFKVKKGKTVKIALVGPTGVGKTTCIAKLAVISKIIHKLKVGLITIDTFRLGAIDQLRIFSEISDIEMAAAYEPEDMKKLLKKFSDKDIVFIDTVGRSQRNSDNLSKIKEYLDVANVDDVMLVVSAATAQRTLNDISTKFKLFNYKSVIFTKADEAASYGPILNLSYNFNTPVTFITNGQVIPDDILAVSSEYIANLIFSGKLY